MTRVTGDPHWFDIQTTIAYPSGQPDVEYRIGAGTNWNDIRTKVDLIYNWYVEQQKEAALREQHPNLKEAWEHYQVLKVLVTSEEDLKDK